MFKRLRKLFTRGVKKVYENGIKPKPKKDKKKLRQRVRDLFKKADTSQIQGTGRDAPVGKYSDYEIGWGRKGDYTNKKGVTFKEDEIAKLKDFVERYNDDITKFRDNILNYGKELFPQIEYDNMVDDIRRAIERDERRFTDTLFEDLRNVDLENYLEKAISPNELNDILSKLEEQKYYDLTERNQQYQKNWVTALYNEYGENSITRRIAEKVEKLDSDLFMTLYYNDASDIHLKALYENVEMEGYLSIVEDEIDKLFKKGEEIGL